MFMCASRNPNGFGSLEMKLATSIVSELEMVLERDSRSSRPEAEVAKKGLVASTVDQLGSNLHAILNNAAALVLTIDKDGIVKDVSGTGIDSLNLVPERLLGRDFIAYSQNIEGLEEALKQALDGQSSRIEIEILGTIFDAWMEPTVSRDGQPGFATVVVSDITDRVTAARSESALNVLRSEKERASKFIVSLSHEMKAPLTTVGMLTEVLGENERGNLHPDQIEQITVVQQNTDRLTRLVNDFLNISKMEAGTFETNPSNFQIRELASDLDSSFEPIAASQDQRLTVTAPNEDQFATADRELLRQVAVNLLANASKHSPSNTNIALDIWVDDRDLRLTVTDEGPGIPHDERDRVFEPYSQLDNANAPGNGMGLAIVKQIVELHHGKVWVEDGVGGGTSFAVWLPGIVSSD
jgi:signal transduction histidine kinase